MKFVETRLPGAFIIELEPREDERGFFARTFCEWEFSAHELETRFVQCNLSLSRKKGTLRGLHFQQDPWAEVKLVRCVRGAIWDVIVDLRTDSATFGHHEAFELSAENRRALYVPRAFAHGFQTLTDNSEVFYQMGTRYVAEAAAGIRAEDPAMGIKWPMPVTEMSEKDRALPTLARVREQLFRDTPLQPVAEPAHPAGFKA
ncbi:MAG TPA: dTDP-4-dehydrorhamnose 3,5-epimerase [Candidatus Sulfotelmatobacter sp.]|nr:dTDP-4-dehydrorhamnose 3,5-epimerase [Candidatus Sulfotelmatobacter sp.]